MVEPVVEEQVCLDIYYVNGHESDKSYVVFKCSITGKSMHNDTITGESGCIDVDPHSSYDILITDKDAEEEIFSIPAIIIPGVSVPNDIQLLTATISITNIPSGWFEVTVTLVLCLEPIRSENEHENNYV